MKTMERIEIFTAKTLDDAKKLAAEDFCADESDIRFEIIEHPKKGLFGTKGEFRVRAIYSQAGNSVEPDSSRRTAVEIDAEPFKHVIDYIEKILTELGVTGYEIKAKKAGENNVLDITGNNLGIIIGRRGETLDALQYLAILANNRGGEENRPRLVLDCNGYREKRHETLEALAIRTSAKVLKLGRRITLEAMNPYERRIIHSKVAGIDGVFSSSIGDEPYRKVVISSEVVKKRTPDRDRGGNRDGNRDRGRRSDNNRDKEKESSVVLTHTPGAVSSAVQSRSYKKSEGFSTSFERDYKRTAAPAPEISQDTVDVEKSASLYGKIEL